MSDRTKIRVYGVTMTSAVLLWAIQGIRLVDGDHSYGPETILWLVVTPMALSAKHWSKNARANAKYARQQT